MHSDGRLEGGGDGTYYRAMVGVAVSDSPTGPFTMTCAHRMYNRQNYQACTNQAVPGQARDMTVFQDGRRRRRLHPVLLRGEHVAVRGQA